MAASIFVLTRRSSENRKWMTTHPEEQVRNKESKQSYIVARSYVQTQIFAHASDPSIGYLCRFSDIPPSCGKNLR